MNGRLLGVQPLLGQQGTKQAVLNRLYSVDLVHFATLGDAERALSSICYNNTILKEDHYLLTMPDIAKVQLRAKLVVLSGYHSTRGQTIYEVVLGLLERS